MPAKASPNAKLRPLWACPKCGQRFVSPNVWHSCVRFAGVALQKRGLRVSSWLKRRIDSPRFAKVELIPPRNFIYSFHVRSQEDLDDEVRAWLAEAYRVGIQEQLAVPAKGKG